jgi:hypothetical protein
MGVQPVIEGALNGLNHRLDLDRQAATQNAGRH